MSRQEIRDREKQKRAKAVAKRRMILLLTMIFMVTIGSVVFGGIFSSAQTTETPVTYKYYKSIKIEKGDTLWSIAKEYCTENYEDTREYIEELKEINNLTSDEIHHGQYLVVAYYDAEFK